MGKLLSLMIIRYKKRESIFKKWQVTFAISDIIVNLELAMDHLDNLQGLI